MTLEPAERGETKPEGGAELPIYYGLVFLYFFAFGLQFVLYPSLAAFSLEAKGAGVGAAQTALSAPMFALLLFGGLVAERVRAATGIGVLHLLMALPPLALGLGVLFDAFSFAALIAYGLAMGALAAFMLPLRDSALNGVVARDLARGGKVSLASAATTTTAVQIAAQILGILAAGLLAERVGNGPLLIVLAMAMVLGAGLALQLKAPKPQATRARTPAAAFGEIKAGLAYAFKDEVMGPMLWSAAYVGVFIVGAFQVLFPLLVRDEYGGGPRELGVLFAIFWFASFISAATLGRLRPLTYPGRALVVSHLIGAGVLLSFTVDKPFWLFQASVAVWGLGAGVAMAMSRTITQSAAAPDYLGRVLAIYSMGFMGGAPIGAFLIGYGVDLFGPRGAAYLPGLGLAAAATALALFTPIWRLEKDDGRARG
jgi:MFS family permease